MLIKNSLSEFSGSNKNVQCFVIMHQDLIRRKNLLEKHSATTNVSLTSGTACDVSRVKQSFPSLHHDLGQRVSV